MSLSHIDRNNQPHMVDVGGKAETRRVARARAVVELPAAVLEHFSDGDIVSAKGPVFQTAIVAGTMAAKRTSELIPMCHPVGLDDCTITIALDERKRVVIETACEVRHKTGVEMEALTAASTAALTVYDMCKGLSHHIVIREIRLLEKTGGKSDFKHDEAT